MSATNQLPFSGANVSLFASGALPYFFGEAFYYFVDKVNGSDGNSGLKPHVAKATIAAAITLANARIDWGTSPWAKRSVIVVAPGTYAENLTSLPYGGVLYGCGKDLRDGEAGVKIKPASGVPIDVNAWSNGSVFNFGFEATGVNQVFDAAILNNCHFEDCFFTGPAETVTAAASLVTNDCVKTTFRRCWFANAAIGMKFDYVDGGDSISYLLVEDCIISGVGTAGIYTSLNLVGPHSIVRRTDIFGGGQTLAIGVDDNSGILQLSNCNITATDPVQGCRAADGCYGNGALLGTTGE